jgi:uncharacterized membrane protein YphA (DoxX/SURF4 family)
MRLPGTILQGILARWALAFLRIGFGCVLILSAWPRLQDSYGPDRMTAVVPWGELLVGIMLVLGLLTRLGAAGLLVLVIQPLIVGQQPSWIPSTPQTTWGLVAVTLLLGAAGRTFGLDSLLARRWLRSPFW